MNMSKGQSNLPQDARGSRLLCSGIKETPIITNMLSFGMSKPVPAEAGNTFLSLLCGPPSLLQYDFSHQSNLKSTSSSSYRDQSAQYNVNVVGSRLLLNDDESLNPGTGLGVHSSFSSGPLLGASNGTERGISGGLNSLGMAHINGTGFRVEKGSNTSLRKGVTPAPSNSHFGEVLLGLTSDPVLGASLQSSSSVSQKKPSIVSGCPRVFCMGASGELLISNTGIFGILCSCHGSHMPVNKFCEHSGLFDINPGYAVRMESGECISQWRKVYLEKFEIRAPEDHRGWDWPEELLATSHLANSSVAVADRRKVFDLSGLFTSSAESVKSIQPWNNVSPVARSSKKNANQVSKGSSRENFVDPCTFHTNSFGSNERDTHANPDTCKSMSSNISISPSTGKLFSSAFLKSQNISFEAYSSMKDDFLDTRPSSIDLKLGQPSPLVGNSKFTENGNQHSFLPDLSRSKEQFQKGLGDSTSSSVHGASYVVNLKHGFANSSATSVWTPHTSAEGIVYQKETTQRTADVHPCMPPALQYQPNQGRTSLINFSCNGNGQIRRLETSKLASQNDNSRIYDARYGCKVSDIRSESSFNIGSKQMESSGFFNGHKKTSNPDMSGLHAEESSSFERDSLLPSTSDTSTLTRTTNSSGRCSTGDLFAKGITNSSMGLGGYQHLKAVSTSCTLSSPALPPRHGSASFTKDIDAFSSHVTGEKLGVPVPRHFKPSAKECSVNAPCGSNQPLRYQDTEQRQKVKPYGVSNLRLRGSFQDNSLAGQRDGHNEPVGQGIALSFLSDVDLQKGTSNTDNSGAFSKELTKNNQGYFDAHLHHRYTHTAPPTCTNREHDLKDTGSLHGFQQQVSFASVESPNKTVGKFNGDFAPIGKDYLPAYKQMEKKRIHRKVDCNGSQWRDVPSKANTVSRIRCFDAAETGRESEDHCKELSAKEIVISNQEVELSKGKALSELSSGCSVPSDTQTSNEVNKTVLCTVDGGDIGYSDQLVDQGSAVVRSHSSASTPNIVKSSELSCRVPTCTEIVLQSIACHGQNDEFEQIKLKSNNLQSLRLSGASFDEFSNEGQEHVNEFQCKKRKHTTRWKMVGASITVSEVSTSPAAPPFHAGKNIAHQTHVCEAAQVCYRDLNGQGLKKRRSTLCQVKMFSCKRGLSRKFVDSNDQSIVRKGDDIPVNTAVKRLKSGQIDEAAKKKAKEKPIACGKYGIICGLELDIDQLKQPKIVPLSQILKSAQRCNNLKYTLVAPLRREMIDAHFSMGKGWCDEFSDFRTSPISQYDKVLSSDDGNSSSSFSEIPKMLCLDNEHLDDDVSMSAEVGSNKRRSNKSVTFSHGATHSKIKEIRLCSLNDLSTRGNKFISVDSSLSDNVRCTSSTDYGLERRQSEDAGESNRPELTAHTSRIFRKMHSRSVTSDKDPLCCVCGISSNDSDNFTLECGRCSIQIHQACYGVSRMPKGEWLCRPCRTNSKDVVCVLCGYGGGAMTRAFGSRNVVKSLLKAWDIRTESHIMIIGSADSFRVPAKMKHGNSFEHSTAESCPLIKPVVHNSIVAGLFNPTIKQWVHMVCGLWSPGTRCPNVDTMSAFDVSDIYHQKMHLVCDICKRPGGSCIKCRVDTCSAFFHPWCAQQKGLLQSEVEGVDGDKVGFYGRCLLHAGYQFCTLEKDTIEEVLSDTRHYTEPTCARIEAYEGKKHEGRWRRSSFQRNRKSECHLTQVQLDAWDYINKHKLTMRRQSSPLASDVEHDYRKEYARFKLAKQWKQLVVYKSGIHAYGLYTSQFIPRGAMVVEYIGEVVGHRVADKRETEYLSGRKLQYKSACYFFRIDKEQIIDATCKGGIARFVNHSCQVVGHRVADKRETEYLSGRKLQYKSACYFFRIDKEQIIDATCKGGIARFVNHSCQPNCIAKVLTIRSEKKVVFLAQRDIYPGEEITYDYHFNREDEGKKIPCLCNAKNCRRYLN